MTTNKPSSKNVTENKLSNTNLKFDDMEKDSQLDKAVDNKEDPLTKKYSTI